MAFWKVMLPLVPFLLERQGVLQLMSLVTLGISCPTRKSQELNVLCFKAPADAVTCFLRFLYKVGLFCERSIGISTPSSFPGYIPCIEN